MTYLPSVPQPEDLPANSQPDFVTNFGTINSAFSTDHVPFGNLIENATSANPCVVTSTAHLLATGDSVTIYNLKGTINNVIIPWSVNGSSSTVTVTDANTFSLDTIDTSAENPYIANSGNFNSDEASYPYGYHKKISFQNYLGVYPAGIPDENSPIGALFTLLFNKDFSGKETEDVDLFFQNAPLIANVAQLTGHVTAYEADIENDIPISNKYGIKTPWGITLNMGFITFAVTAATPKTITFPTGYTYATDSHYTTVATMGSNASNTATDVVITATTETGFTISTISDTAINYYYFSIGATA